MKKSNYLEVFVYSLFIALLGINLYFTLNQNTPEIIMKVPEYRSYKDPIYLIDNVGFRFSQNHKYVKDDYDCDNYTNDMSFILDSLGIENKKMKGCEDLTINTSCHAWLRVELDYEPITGSFTDYSKEYIGIEEYR